MMDIFEDDWRKLSNKKKYTSTDLIKNYEYGCSKCGELENLREINVENFGQFKLCTQCFGEILRYLFQHGVFDTKKEAKYEQTY